MQLTDIEIIKNNHKSPAAELLDKLSGDWTTKKAALDDYDNYRGKSWQFVRDSAYCISRPNKNTEIDMPLAEIPRLRTFIETTYESRSSKWGAYNPHQYLIIWQRRSWYGIPWRKERRTHLCHGATLSSLRQSKYYNRRKVARDLDVEEIVCGKVTHRIGFIAISGQVEFHAQTRQMARDGLKDKLIARQHTREQNRLNRQTHGQLITVSGLKKDLGFCDTGIRDFVETCLPELISRKSIRANELYHLLQENWNVCREYYRDDLVQLVRYTRTRLAR